MLRRISLLAGQINRHKNQQAGLAHTPQSNYPYHGSNYRTLAEPYHARRSAIDGPEGTGYSSSWRRGGYPSRGHPRAHMSVHRHRSLVLNGASQQNRPADAESGANSDASTSSWVTKNDRHLQLINSSVYEKEVQARTRAIEQTRRQNRALRDQRERAKLMSHLQHVANGTGVGSTNSPATANNHEIVVQGIRFVVAKNGSKLIKVSDNLNSAKTTPKMAVVGGVRFYRTKNGNLYRHGVVHAQRHSGTVRKVDVPCQTFSMTGNSIFQRAKRPRPRRSDWDSVSPQAPTDFFDRILYERPVVPVQARPGAGCCLQRLPSARGMPKRPCLRSFP